MKLFATLLFAALLSFDAASQANAVVFSEMGENFTAYLNGQKQNNSPTNNVKMENLTGEFYQLRVDFEDASLKDLTSNMAVQQGIEATYVVKVNKKGEYVLRFFAEAPIGSAKPVAEPVHSPAVEPDVDHVVVEEVIIEQPAPAQDVEITVVETTTVKTGKPQPAKTPAPGTGTGDGKVAISINVDGNTMDMNMDVPGVQMDMDVDGMDTEVIMDEPAVETRTVTTTTKTTTRTNTNTNTQVDVVQPAPAAKPTRYTMPGYNGPVGCDWPMESAEFSEALNSIKSKSFSDSKMTLAKQITKGRCVTASQVKDILGVLDFEGDKLEFAKFAYDYTFDQGNYYKVNDAFDFESTIDELNQYLETK